AVAYPSFQQQLPLKGEGRVCVDKHFMAYPSFQQQLPLKGEGRVCVDKHFITSVGPGSAMEFALEIVKRLVGEAKYEELKKGLCMP
ncbi:hypothetical protein ENH_00013490, partial [Eimeria necatrix]